MASSATSAELLGVLRRLHPSEIDLSLERLEILLERLDHPERSLPPVVHVAGTNGKGSTIAFVRAGLEAAGYRVHAYTSPHLVNFHERIRVAGKEIEEHFLASALSDVINAVGTSSITFFEATTCAAMLAFSRVPADYTLLEVGMGGRLDATNAAGLSPSICVITPVSLDHQDFLGSTVEAIAREKAGILRRGVPAVVSNQDPAAMRVIRARAMELQCPMLICDEAWEAHASDGNLHYSACGPFPVQLKLPLPCLFGSHQVSNAAVAITVLRALGHCGNAPL